MHGFQLVRRTREILPDIKVIMMTAFEVNKPEFETVFPSMKSGKRGKEAICAIKTG